MIDQKDGATKDRRCLQRKEIRRLEAVRAVVNYESNNETMVKRK